MAGPAAAVRRLGRGSSWQRQSATAAASIFVAAFVFLIVTRASDQGVLLAAALIAGTAVVAYCFLVEDPGRPLIIFMLYITLVDGYLKLKTGSAVIVVGRDVLLAAIAAGMLTRAVIRRDMSIPPLTAAVVLYVAIVLVQIAHPDAVSLRHSIEGLRPHLEWVPLFFIAFAYLRTASRLRTLFMLLLVVTSINGVVALVQYQLTPQQLAGWGPGYRDRIYGANGIAGRTAFNSRTGLTKVRPFALGSDTGFGGSLAVLAGPAALALFTARRRRATTGRLLAALSAGGVLLALVTSQARITLVLAAVGLFAYAALGSLSRQRARLLAGLLVGAAMAWLALSLISARTDVSVFDRYDSIAPNRVVDTALNYKNDTFRVTRDYFSEIPFGAGLGNVGPGASGLPASSESYNGESEFNFLLVELGIPGLIVVTGLLLGLLLLAFTRVPRVEDDDLRPLLAALAASLAATLFGFAGAPVTAGTPLGPFVWMSGGALAYWLIYLPRLEQRRLMALPFANR